MEHLDTIVCPLCASAMYRVTNPKPGTYLCTECRTVRYIDEHGVAWLSIARESLRERETDMRRQHSET